MGRKLQSRDCLQFVLRCIGRTNRNSLYAFGKWLKYGRLRKRNESMQRTSSYDPVGSEESQHTTAVLQTAVHLVICTNPAFLC
jgi:hypothetical protein